MWPKDGKIYFYNYLLWTQLFFNSAWHTHPEAEIHVMATKGLMKLIWNWAASATQTGTFTESLNEHLYLFCSLHG
jgi:hypothetical protein